jgi:2-hydroxy-6-oxonona-2,4-dienedioate hydrolase
MTDDSLHTDIAAYPISAGGVLSRALEAGVGDKVIVCLHGTGSRADRWRSIMPGLAAAGYHVYAVDCPGHGFAAKDGGYTYTEPAFAGFAADFIAQVSPQGAVIVGTSMGGHLATLIARDHPHLVAAVAFVGGVGLVSTEHIPREQGPDTSDGTEAGVRAKLRHLVHDQRLVTDAWVREEQRINSSPGARAALSELGRYSHEQDIVGEAYRELGIPTILIWGAQDRWVPVSWAHAARGLLPGAPLVLIDRAGHAPYFERPDAFNEVLLDYLSDPRAFGSDITVV